MSELSLDALSARDRTAIEARQAEVRAAMRRNGITPLADLPPLTRETAQVVMVRFASALRMADVRAAAAAIGCELRADRRGQLVIAPRR